MGAGIEVVISKSKDLCFCQYKSKKNLLLIRKKHHCFHPVMLLRTILFRLCFFFFVENVIHSQVASVNTLCKSVLNVKNTVIKNCNLYSDKNGVKHIRIQVRPNKWHENDCPFCHKSCPVYDKHSSSIMPRYYEDNS